MPKSNTALAQLSGATDLYVNSGLWQIPQAAESKLLTNFTTLYGRSDFILTNFPLVYLVPLEVLQRRGAIWPPRCTYHVDDLRIGLGQGC